MTVMAHPDDAEVWAGGTIAAHTRRGGHAIIAVPRHSAVRDAEATQAAAILGAKLRFLDDASAGAIAALVTEVQPEVIITHPAHDIHPEHRATAANLSAGLPDVVIATGHPRRMYSCDGYNNLDQHGRPLHLPIVVDITGTFDTKTAALQCHASQPIAEHFGPMVRALGQLHGMRVATGYAEAFAPLPILGRIPTAPGL